MKLSLAPIQGMTIFPYRNAFNELFGGIDAFYSPFIATKEAANTSPSLFKDILPENNPIQIPLIPQVLSNKAADFSYYAKQITDMGYKEINWNIGCPYPMVTKKKKGSGMMPYPDLIRSFLEEVCHDLDYALSVKMRLGLDSPQEGLAVIEVLNEYPLKELIIHGRIGSQKYEGKVNLEAFDTLLKSSKHPVAYNGDLFSLADYQKISPIFPSVNHFMLGRGGLRDPFLPSEIRGITYTKAQKQVKLMALHDAMYTHYQSILSGDKHLIDRMNEFWSYTASLIEGSDKYLKKIKKCSNKSDYLDLVTALFSNY